MRFRLVVKATVLLLAIGGSAASESFRAVGWNVESDRVGPVEDTSDARFISRQVAAKTGVHLWGFCEVYDAQEFAIYEQAAEEAAGHALSSEFREYGGKDCIGLLYDPSVFDSDGSAFVVPNWDGDRAGLVQPLKWRATGQSFMFVVNHLNRGKPERRKKQARALNAWARDVAVPIIAVGDYNLDYAFQPEGDRDPAYDVLVEGGIFTWARPSTLLKTNASDGYAPSVLDFVFLAHQPAGWTVQSRILDREGDQPAAALDFDDDHRSTDHRPVDAIVMTGEDSSSPGLLNVNEIRRRLDAIDTEVRALRALIATP